MLNTRSTLKRRPEAVKLKILGILMITHGSVTGGQRQLRWSSQACEDASNRCNIVPDLAVLYRARELTTTLHLDEAEPR